MLSSSLYTLLKVSKTTYPQKLLELLTYKFFTFPISVKKLARSIFLSVLFMHFLKYTSEFPLFTPLQPPSGLFNVALKLFELLTY